MKVAFVVSLVICTQSPVKIRALSGDSPLNSGLKAVLISEVIGEQEGISKLVQCLVLGTCASFHHKPCVSEFPALEPDPSFSQFFCTSARHLYFGLGCSQSVSWLTAESLQENIAGEA